MEKNVKTDTERVWPCDHRDKDWDDASSSQRMLGATKKLEETRQDLPLEGSWPYQHLEFGFLSSRRLMKWRSSVVKQEAQSQSGSTLNLNSPMELEFCGSRSVLLICFNTGYISEKFRERDKPRSNGDNFQRYDQDLSRNHLRILFSDHSEGIILQT
jgi:hypothetical protein